MQRGGDVVQEAPHYLYRTGPHPAGSRAAPIGDPRASLLLQ